MTNPIPPLVSIKSWLKFGWQCYKQTAWQSSLFSVVLTLFAALLYYLILSNKVDLIMFPFIAGFFIVGPIIITGFQQVAALLENGKSVSLAHFFLIKSENKAGIWFLIFILTVCYLIWITDALVIYSLYFGIEALPLDQQFFSDEKLTESLFFYLLYSGFMGLVCAVIGFTLGVFSIPLMIHKGCNFVSAVNLSIKTVFQHKLLMLRWATCLVVIVSLTLTLLLPLLPIIFPILAYASYAVYRDLIDL
jgi:uncharacterized membrane protein